VLSFQGFRYNAKVSEESRLFRPLFPGMPKLRRTRSAAVKGNHAGRDDDLGATHSCEEHDREKRSRDRTLQLR